MMTKRRADLHNHTTFSDGDATPAELVARAKELDLTALGVTDHDTISGLPDALLAGESQGVEIICGMEMTLSFAEPLFTGSLHLLLYFPRQLLLRQDFLDSTAETLSLGRGDALVRARLDAINEHFAPGAAEPLLPRPLLEEDIYAHGHQISRRPFALALKELGFSDRAPMSRLIGNDSPAYIPSGAPMESLAGYLGRFPFARVLAHPAAGSFPGDSHYKEVLPPFETVEQLLPRFLSLGLDGFEVHYPAHTGQWVQRLQEKRRELGLPLATGGSDTHDQQLRPLGTRTVPYEVVERIGGLLEDRSKELGI